MKTRQVVVLTLFLIAIDQFVKLAVDALWLNASWEIIGDYVMFRPVLNTHYSWVNSMFNLGIGQLTHIVIVGLFLAVALVIYSYLQSKQITDGLVQISFVLLFAGIICSLIDKIFWGGSLDFIRLKGLFTFDLKDVYITFWEVLIIGMLLFNYQGLAKLDEKASMRAIAGYFRDKVLRR